MKITFETNEERKAFSAAFAVALASLIFDKILKDVLNEKKRSK